MFKVLAAVIGSPMAAASLALAWALKGNALASAEQMVHLVVRNKIVSQYRDNPLHSRSIAERDFNCAGNLSALEKGARTAAPGTRPQPLL